MNCTGFKGVITRTGNDPRKGTKAEAASMTVHWAECRECRDWLDKHEKMDGRAGIPKEEADKIVMDVLTDPECRKMLDDSPDVNSAGPLIAAALGGGDMAEAIATATKRVSAWLDEETWTKVTVDYARENMVEMLVKKCGLPYKVAKATAGVHAIGCMMVIMARKAAAKG